jgi:Ca2+/Na+ antiporter
LFVFLKSTAEKYLTPSLRNFGKELGLSQTLMGISLLAFANGSPDIISSLSAAGETSGVFITIGGLFGAGIFVNTIVLANVIRVSPNQIYVSLSPLLILAFPGFNEQLSSVSINREILFYLFAVVLLLSYGFVKKITFPMALSFLCLYFM